MDGCSGLLFVMQENVGSLVEAESTTAEELIQALYTMHRFVASRETLSAGWPAHLVTDADARFGEG